MERTPVLVIGIGNLLWADEGFGVRCVEELHRRFDFPPGVRLLDGGTQGLYLVSDVCACERLLVLDAIDFGDPPGTVRVVVDDEVPRFAICKKMSAHQTGFQDVLAAVDLMGQAPKTAVLIGVQPVEMEDLGGGLTPLVAAAVEPVVQEAVRQLERWGFAPTPRRRPPLVSLLGPGLERESYEGRRPSEVEACRQGDPRFLFMPREC
jgi:hydrogenase maturation protease